MIFTASPLLTRLRRHRGLWVLAIAVLMIKLVSSSVCLGDDPAARLAVTQTATSVTADVVVAPADMPVDNACLLGETSACHCACAHALTLTTRMALFVAPPAAGVESGRLSLGLVPETTGSLLRPPIA